MITGALIAAGVLFVIAAVAAPFEALNWWATTGALESREVNELTTGQALATEPAAADDPHASYLVYLSGVGAITERVLAQGEEPFLAELHAALPDVALVRDVYPYSVQNRGLLTDRWTALWWRLIRRLSESRLAGVTVLLVYVRNVLQFAVSADDRYGPMYAIGVARVVRDRLLAAGYQPAARRPVILFGWSGGAQIAVACARYLAGLGMPVYVIGLGGVVTSDPGLERLTHLWLLIGRRDLIPHIGRLFPGRWPWRRRSYWWDAHRAGRITEIDTGPMTHVGRGSYLSSTRLPDGRTCRQSVLARIAAIVEEAGLCGPSSSATDAPRRGDAALPGSSAPADPSPPADGSTNGTPNDGSDGRSGGQSDGEDLP